MKNNLRVCKTISTAIICAICIFTLPKAHSAEHQKVDAYPVSVKGKIGFINHTGSLIIPATFDNADSFSEGLASVQVNGKYGYINEAGKFEIEPQFDAAGPFSEGLACVQINSLWGYINAKGNQIVHPSIREENCYSFHDGYALVQGETQEIHQNRLQHDRLSRNLNALMGFNAISKQMQPASYFIKRDGAPFRIAGGGTMDKAISVREFSDGIGWYQTISGDWNAIDQKGNKIVGPIPSCSAPGNFYDGIARNKAQCNASDGYISIKLGDVSFVEYQQTGNFSNGVSWVSQADKFGYINEKAEVVIPITYENVSSFDQEIAFAQTGNSVGLIDKLGHWIAAPQYHSAITDYLLSPFIGDLGKLLIIDDDGSVCKTAMIYVNRSGAKVWEGELLIQDKNKIADPGYCARKKSAHQFRRVQ